MQYVRALAPASYRAVSRVTADNVPSRGVLTGLEVYARATENIYLRTGEWGAEDPELADSDGSRWGYSGVARLR